MARSRDVIGSNQRISVRFTEKLATELLQAATFVSKGNYEGARRCWETAEQMLDTFRTETGIEEYLDAGNTIPTPAAPVAAKGKRAAKGKSTKGKAPKGAGPSSEAGPTAGDSD